MIMKTHFHNLHPQIDGSTHFHVNVYNHNSCLPKTNFQLKPFSRKCLLLSVEGKRISNYLVSCGGNGGSEGAFAGRKRVLVR